MNLPSGNFSSKNTSQFIDEIASKLTTASTKDFIFLIHTSTSTFKGLATNNFKNWRSLYYYFDRLVSFSNVLSCSIQRKHLKCE